MMGLLFKREGRIALPIARCVYLYSLELMVLSLMFHVWFLGHLVAIYLFWRPILERRT